MKKLLLIVFFFIFSNGLRAQSAYIPFVNNMIIYGATQLQDMGGLQAPAFFRTEIYGDTVIGVYTYSKIYSGLGPFVVVGGIRNDTLNKKVYKYSVATGSEKLLYDFNINVGDTLNASSGYGFYDPLINVSTLVPTPIIEKAWVTSIDSVLMPYDAIFHRRFNFKAQVAGLDSFLVSESNAVLYDTLGFGWTRTILMHSLIEGVGQMSNPISAHSSTSMGYPYQLYFGLVCSSINGVTNFNMFVPPGYDLAYCNSIYAGFDEIKESEDFILFPNPTSGFFQIKSDQEINSIEVTDVFGRRIFYSEKNQSEINMSNFMNGIYFVRLIDSKGNSVVKKIIKN